VSDGHAVVGLWHSGRLATRWARDLVPTGEIAVPSPAKEVLDATVALVPPEELGAAVLLAPRASGRPRGWLLFVGEHLWHFAGEGRLQATPVNMGWRPGAFWGDLNSAPPLSWRLAGEGLELTGISLDGSVHWSEVQFQDEASTDAIVHAAVPQSGYAAATLVGPGRVAAVRRAGIDWLRLERRRLLPWTATGIDLAGAVGCCHSAPTNQLLVVGRDGWLVRVPVPH
jgi:hypothetical protein